MQNAPGAGVRGRWVLVGASAHGDIIRPNTLVGLAEQCTVVRHVDVVLAGWLADVEDSRPVMPEATQHSPAHSRVVLREQKVQMPELIDLGRDRGVQLVGLVDGEVADVFLPYLLGLFSGAKEVVLEGELDYDAELPAGECVVDPTRTNFRWWSR